MNYGDIEKQTFKTYLTFSTVLLIFLLAFFSVSSSVYRVNNIIYEEKEELNYSSIDKLKGTSIWLIDDTYFDSFYQENPTVEKISIKKELPTTLVVNIEISEKIAYIEDLRRSPSNRYILYKNLFTSEVNKNERLMFVTIGNGPLNKGFKEEIVTFVMTLKKYSVNTSNIELVYDGEVLKLTHFDTAINLGRPSDLARKAAVVGYYLAEGVCDGEIRIVYSENEAELTAITNCN